MKSSAWLVVIICVFGSCKDTTPPPEPLDPTLVAIAGENYEDYLIEETKAPAWDTVQMLSFENTHLTFDLRTNKKVRTHQFRYTNIGNTASYIQLITSACNCMKENSEKEILNPGESDELNITFDQSLWEPGESKSLYVFTKHFPHQYELIIERNR